MRTYFRNLLCSAWATKAEWFVLVGFAAGVGIAFIFGISQAWEFSVGMAQIVGGFGVAAAVGVAVRQIRAIDELDEKTVKRKQRHAAIRVYAALATHRHVFVIAKKSLTQTLCEKDVSWSFNGFDVDIIDDSTDQIRSNFQKSVLRSLPNLELTEASILLSEVENGREGTDQSEFDYLESIRFLKGCILTLQMLLAEEREYMPEHYKALHNSIVFNIQVFLKMGPELASRLIDEFPVQKSIDDGEAFSESDWMKLVWPQAVDFVKLATENPPVNWGSYYTRAEIAWHADGKTGTLPVDTG